MEMKGEYRIPASREKVWDALNDPEVLRDCIPGAKSLEKTSDTEMKATVEAKVGPVKASFTGQVTLSNIDPPNGYTITGESKGGVAGFATVLTGDGGGDSGAPEVHHNPIPADQYHTAWCADRAIDPIQQNTQPSDQPAMISSALAPSTPRTPPSGR